MVSRSRLTLSWAGDEITAQRTLNIRLIQLFGRPAESYRSGLSVLAVETDPGLVGPADPRGQGGSGSWVCCQSQQPLDLPFKYKSGSASSKILYNVGSGR